MAQANAPRHKRSQPESLGLSSMALEEDDTGEELVKCNLGLATVWIDRNWTPRLKICRIVKVINSSRR